MKFRDYFSLKHILFAVVLMALMVLLAINQSVNTVKVYFESTEVQVLSAKYSLAEKKLVDISYCGSSRYRFAGTSGS